MRRASSVDDFIAQHPRWEPVLRKLRAILIGTELRETIKWGAPCYTLDGKNVVGMAGFKEHCGLWFHQGVFLSDPDAVLINAQEGRTKALRQWRFTDAAQVKIARVKAYVREAIDNQKQGRELAPERGKPVEVPPELQAALRRTPGAKKAFDALSLGKRREYAEHIATAKQDKTKASRIEKILPQIAAGVGLHDKYRSC
ncbi:MAG: YdeI/OmpD-associated family protein [Planctomycetes bacterium]|nr:YdeI/OmpD-associated family protein [Planctomycetota bacterium]MCB9868784.1 YdeI/OmpD-associated family protein [Planctomycetota bacterium]